ncbi:MAG: sugar ABC transporter permease [Chloroflexota bacterium]|nr:MAG: sugar ABC transporter permease [Chloroflexota bacterium]
MDQVQATPSREAPPSGLQRLLGGLGAGISNVVLAITERVMSPLQQRIGVQRMAYVFVLPNLLIFGIFILLPMLLNFYYSFTGGTNLFPQDRPWVGLENFERLFACENFLQPNTCVEDRFARSMVNTAGFVVAQVALVVLLSLITALALNRKIVARGFFRSVFFYPVLLSPVVVALIWKWILQQDGLLNALIVPLGGDKISFLTSGDWARFWVVIISVWSTMGFYMLILLAGLQSIPAELYEAAAIDGANAWTSFRKVTLPLLMPTMMVVLVLSVIRAVQVFDVVYAFTGGGPGTATFYLVQYIYTTAFTNLSTLYGLASAASVVLAVILVVFTLLQLRLGGTSSDVADA